jgi:SAM-dependent methyltransferase
MAAMAPARSIRGHSPTIRTTRALDLSRPGVLHPIGAEQIAYYRARAPWYDDVYTCVGDYDRGTWLNAQWRADLALVAEALVESPLHGDCVELGSGTGYWTDRVVDRVERLWALDAAPEVHGISRARLGSRATNVTFEIVDLWRWQPARVWDAAVAFLFLEHVPDEVLPDMLAVLHDALRPGAPLFVAEGGAHGPVPAIETRSIDGRAFDVIERRRSPQEVETALASAGFSLKAVTTGRLIHFQATRD